MTKEQTILKLLEQAGDKGITVHEMMLRGGGNDVRKYISNLRKQGEFILDKWEHKGKVKYKRYYLY